MGYIRSNLFLKESKKYPALTSELESLVKQRVYEFGKACRKFFHGFRLRTGKPEGEQIPRPVRLSEYSKLIALITIGDLDHKNDKAIDDKVDEIVKDLVPLLKC